MSFQLQEPNNTVSKSRVFCWNFLSDWAYEIPTVGCYAWAKGIFFFNFGVQRLVQLEFYAGISSNKKSDSSHRKSEFDGFWILCWTNKKSRFGDEIWFIVSYSIFFENMPKIALCNCARLTAHRSIIRDDV